MEGPTMPKSVEIENIEELRRREGIVDVELRDEICGLQIGDFVKVTLLTGARSCGETVSVRITGIRGNAFRGKVATRPASAGLSKLRIGSFIAFSRAHIHSTQKGELTH
jgi:hypothetical protein